MLTLLINRLKTRFTTDWHQVDWRQSALLILLILALFAALWQYAMPRERTITTTEFRRVPVIQETVKIKRVLVPCPEKGLVALDKQAVAERLDLYWLQGGDIVAANGLQEVTSPSPEGTRPVAGSPADLQVTATAAIPESKNGVDVISVTNTATGETTLVAKEQPAPWFQLRNDAAIGVKYGVNQNLIYVGTAYGKWDFLRVRNFYLSANGDISTDGAARLQVGGEYRW